jgi:hypothetical protein
MGFGLVSFPRFRIFSAHPPSSPAKTTGYAPRDNLSLGDASVMIRPKKYRKSSNSQENKQIRALDELAMFEEFRATLLPALLKDVQDGLTDEQMREKYLPIAQARAISEMVLPGGNGLAAARDLIDRTRGKAVERKELRHRLDALDEKQVDALVAARLNELAPPDEE